MGDGNTPDTSSIQTAIDTCSKNGGGTVYFPAGVYLSGTIYLKDHVRLDLDAGATLLGSPRVEDYPFMVCGLASRADRYNGRALIWGENLGDIAITGRGTIDGQGAQFRTNRASADELKALMAAYKGESRYAPNPDFINRPFIIRLIGCRNVLVENVTLRHSPMWMQHYLNCEFVTIRGINVFNHGCKNNDMMDIDGCRNVVISDCFGDTDDDALTLKSTSQFPTENVTISNCIVRSHCNAIKAGTESSGGFRNITITNCVIQPSMARQHPTGRPEGLAGIALEMVDGGTLEGVTISNVTIEETSAPIFLRLGDRARPPSPDVPTPAVGTFRNVLISHVVAQGAGETGCSIVGLPGHRIENVTLSNVRIDFDGGGTSKQATDDVPELEEKYPESTMFGVLPAYGFFCRHVEGLTFRDVAFGFQEPEKRPALIFDDVRRLKLTGFNAPGAPGGSAQVILKNCQEALISQCRPATTDAFLRLERKSGRISVIANDLSGVKRPFGFDESTPESALHSECNHIDGR